MLTNLTHHALRRYSTRRINMATSTDMKGNVVKMEVDYTDTVDKRIPECEALSAVRKKQNFPTLFV